MKLVVKNYLDAKLGMNTDPSLLYSVLDIDKREVIAEVWTARSGFEWVKVSMTGEILEHYRQQGLPDGVLFRSYALDSLSEIEFYRMDNDRLTKHDTKSRKKLGFTQGPESLPKSFESKLDTTQLQRLVYWAEKSYGRVVGIAPQP